MEQNRAEPDAKQPGLREHWIDEDANSRLSARLKQILQTPGISDKDRKLVEGNLKRLLDAYQHRKT